MIEFLATFARWLQLAANLTLLGSCVFLVIAGSTKNAFIRPWINRVNRLFLWLTICIICGLLGILAMTAGQITGQITNALNPNIWLGIVQDTRMGHIWAIRLALAFVLLGVVIYLRYATRARWRYVLCGVIAALPLIAGSFVSHSAAEDLSVLVMLPYVLHIIFAGVWLGALPAFLVLLFAYIKKDSIQSTNSFDTQTLARFSQMALPVMLIVIATGIIVAYRMFDGEYAAMVSTPYGWLFSVKLLLLAIILAIAAKVRSYWLPFFIQGESAVNCAVGMGKLVRIEFVIALVLLLVATVLSNTTPAKHAFIENWPFSFRFSIIATWDQNVAIQVWIGVAIFILAGLAILLGRTKKWNMKRQVGIPLALVIGSFAVALPPLAVTAYPETFQKSIVPFDAISIANGAMLYSENCVICHGPQGKGNGILSRTLSTLPIDMLTEPHTEEHRAGDFYHWLTYGIEGTEMPGYPEIFTEADRWDLVNFIHALSRGYQARILLPEIVPNKPYVMPPNFFYATDNGTSGTLHDFRGEKSVILVVFSWPQSQDRIEQLSQMYDKLRDQDAIILAVPMEVLDAEAKEQIKSKIPFLLVTQGSSEIASSYALFRRTLSRPDLLGAGEALDHMEFLIDRYGYLRARWIPESDKTGWRDIELLTHQINQLNQEKQILSLPNDFVY